ncbi:YqjF family protein [Spirosoma pomorum]
MAFTFLTAEWRNLIFANYAIDRRVLEPLVPYGTELDEFEGVCYGSLVGFYFQNVKMLGKVAVPFHREFEEFNLRFYVRRRTDAGWQRGVVFVKEIVPKLAITLVANTLYGEPYATHPMRHRWQPDGNRQLIEYEWKVGANWNHIRVLADQTGHALIPGSEEAFITEHYWGYTKRTALFSSGSRTSEYEVVHPQWQIYPVYDYSVRCDVATLYGPQFAPFFEGSPHSVFLADGSAVAIRSGATLRG